MKKALITASVVSFIQWFNRINIDYLSKELGCEVHIACNFNYHGNTDKEKSAAFIHQLEEQGCILHNIAFARSPYAWQNIKAYLELKEIIDAEQFALIHCHTPAVGVIARLAGRESRWKHGTKVLYTAHGFHFYQGAPLKNWLLYYPVEKFMCRYTDTLITINEEDTELARRKFKVTNVHMHGVGVDSQRFFPVSAEEKQAIRHQLGIRKEHRIILCVGELNANKNQQVLIHAAARIAFSCPELMVLLAGSGENEGMLRKLISQLHMEKHVQLLGFCANIQQYVQAADIVVSCSLREGLAVNIIEGMLAARPVVASANRGHRELVQEGVTGFIVPPSDAEACAVGISRLLNDAALYQRMSQAAHERAQRYTITSIIPELKEVYGQAMAGNSLSTEFRSTRI